MGEIYVAQGSGLCAGGEVPEEGAQRLALVCGRGDGGDRERGGAREDVGGKHALQAQQVVILRLLPLRRLVLYVNLSLMFAKVPVQRTWRKY